MQKTLGGDRLGSGNKMKVQLHGYERSTHDLGYIWRSTMSAGTLVPFMNELALPGDTFDIDLDCDIKTHPTVGPLFGSFKVQLDVFLTPIRLYNAMLHNNMINIGRDIAQVKFPIMELTAEAFDIEDPTLDVNNCQINPSCILAYMGIRGIGRVNPVDVSATRTFNAISILNYWDTVKNYYSNKQEEIGAVIHTSSTVVGGTTNQVDIILSGAVTLLQQDPLLTSLTPFDGDQIRLTYIPPAPAPNGSRVLIQTSLGWLTADQIFENFVELTPGEITGTLRPSYGSGAITLINWRPTTAVDSTVKMPEIATFPLSNIDEMRTAILQAPAAAAFDIITPDLEPYKWIIESTAGIPPARLFSQEGLAIKTYQSDLFNNWIKTEWIDGPGGINELTAIDTSGGSFNLEQLLLSRKLYDMLNRIAVSGGTYYDWLEVVFDHQPYRPCETPMYMGGLIKEVIFQEIFSNSETAGQPLGTLAGKGIMAKKHKGGKVIVKVDEPSYVLGIVSLTPRIDYSQGNRYDVHLRTLDDIHKPPMDQIGFQDLITEQMAWWDTEWDATPGEWVQSSAGKQPAWLNYMTNYNRTFGNFAIPDNEMFMTLNRRYEHGSGGIVDLTTYIDPSKYNFIFAETALDAQNFWCQIAVDFTARRKMSAKIMPNL